MQKQWNLNRVLASSVVALLAATSLHAIPKNSCEPKQDVCCDDPKPGPLAFNYPMDLGLSCPQDFYFHIDGLAFQAAQDGMEFAIVDSNTSSSTYLTNGDVLGFDNNHSTWDYNEGFRFGFGFFLNHDAWNLDFNWTWVHITNYKNHHTTSGETLIPLWLLGAGNGALTGVTSASAVWNAKYNVLDARLAKAYHVSRYFVLTPSFGARGGWIDQHYSTHYSGTVANIGTATIQHSDNNFWGFGARMGLDTDWRLSKGWCIFSKMSASMLYGKFDIDQNISPASGDGFAVDRDMYQNVPNIEMSVGIGWSQLFNQNKYNFGIRAAYEFIEWFDQLNLRKFSSGTPDYANDVVSRGNLTLNGFSLRLQLDI